MKPLLALDTTGRTGYPPAARALLDGLPVRLESRPMKDQATLLASAGDADLLLFTNLRFDDAVFAALPRLKALVRYGVGLDTVDLAAAEARGVRVRNVRGFCTEEIADHALGLLLALARGLFQDARLVRDGHWRRGPQPVRRVSGQRLGLVGCGAIGRALAARAQALGLTVSATDPALTPAAAAELGIGLTDLPTLLREADFLSLHCSLTDETRGLIGRAQIALMKPTAYLINTARGGLIDQVALTEALAAGRLAGAGLDVCDPEVPAVEDPLRRLDNVILTPHVAWYSQEAGEDLVLGAFRNVAELVGELTGGAE